VAFHRSLAEFVEPSVLAVPLWLGSWRNTGQESLPELLELEFAAEATDMKHGRITIRQNRAISIPTCFFIGVNKETLVENSIY
jgi:hypothetical protein